MSWMSARSTLEGKKEFAAKRGEPEQGEVNRFGCSR